MSDINNSVSRILGKTDTNEFLTDFWQKKPLLIKNALPETPALSADELAGLAMEDEIESRLVFEDQQSASWQLQQGPFSEQRLTELPMFRSNW